MSFWEVLILGVGLSMDAFAVSLCKGLSMRKLNIRQGLIIAGCFGGFQALMPLIGWLVGELFEQYISSVGKWIAFALLLYVGIKMIIDGIKEMREGITEEDLAKAELQKLKVPEMLGLSLATSIDALAVGVSFALLHVSAVQSSPDKLNIWFSILTIGLTTFILSFGGVVLGNLFGSRFSSKAQIAGGIVLVLIGVKMLF